MSNSEQNSVFNKELLKAWNIQRQCTMEEFVRRMREEKICPMFNSKENRKENFDMSMISVLTEKLRELENDPEIDCYGIRELNNICAQAADTIEALSAKLAAANMERSDIEKYDEMRKELKHSIIDLDADHYKLSEFMRVIDEVFVKYRNEIWQPLPEPYRP